MYQDPSDPQEILENKESRDQQVSLDHLATLESPVHKDLVGFKDQL